MNAQETAAVEAQITALRAQRKILRNIASGIDFQVSELDTIIRNLIATLPIQNRIDHALE